MLCLVKQWRHCTDPGLPSIIDEGVMFHTSLTDCTALYVCGLRTRVHVCKHLLWVCPWMFGTCAGLPSEQTYSSVCVCVCVSVLQ